MRAQGQPGQAREVELDTGVFSGPGNRDVHVAIPLTIRSQSDVAAKCVVDCKGATAAWRPARRALYR
jgi:hypothetical protein